MRRRLVLPGLRLGSGLLLLAIVGCDPGKPAETPAAVAAAAAVLPPKPAEAPSTVPTVDLKGQDEAIATAVENAQTLVRRNPQQAPAWGKLGMVFQVHGFAAPAAVCLREAARLDPAEVRWPYYLATILRETDRKAALVELQRAASLLTPQWPPAAARAVRQTLSEALLVDGQAEKALATLALNEGGSSLDPGDELLRARACVGLGRWDEAREHSGRAAESAGTRRDALLILAQLAQRRGDTETARTYSSQAATLRPWQKSDPLAAELHQEARGLHHELARGSLLLDAGRIAEARQSLQQTVLFYPKSAYAWLTLGKAELPSERWSRAESSFRKALELDPGMVEAHFQLGQALRPQGRLEDAVACYRRATEIKRDSVPAQYMLGMTLAELGRTDEAIEAFRVCVECRPQQPEAHLRLARLLGKKGDVTSARAHLETARRLSAGDNAARQLLEEVSVEIGSDDTRVR